MSKLGNRQPLLLTVSLEMQRPIPAAKSRLATSADSHSPEKCKAKASTLGEVEMVWRCEFLPNLSQQNL